MPGSNQSSGKGGGKSGGSNAALHDDEDHSNRFKGWAKSYRENNKKKDWFPKSPKSPNGR